MFPVKKNFFRNMGVMMFLNLTLLGLIIINTRDPPERDEHIECKPVKTDG